MKFFIECRKGKNYLEEILSEASKIWEIFPHKVEFREVGDTYRYCLQSESGCFQEMKRKIFDCVAKYILYASKLDFYSNNLCKFLSQNKQFILARVLMFSDFEAEKAEVIGKTISNDTISIDGVENFLIRGLKPEWQKTCDVVNYSCCELQNEDSYKEFIKCVSSSIVSKHRLLYFFSGKSNALLSEKLENISPTMLGQEKLSRQQGVISALIENYPKNVAIFEENNSGVVYEALEILFDSRKNAKSTKSI